MANLGKELAADHISMVFVVVAVVADGDDDIAMSYALANYLREVCMEYFHCVAQNYHGVVD